LFNEIFLPNLRRGGSTELLKIRDLERLDVSSRGWSERFEI
jgi:hypothetical protein